MSCVADSTCMRTGLARSVFRRVDVMLVFLLCVLGYITPDEASDIISLQAHSLDTALRDYSEINFKDIMSAKKFGETIGKIRNKAVVNAEKKIDLDVVLAGSKAAA